MGGQIRVHDVQVPENRRNTVHSDNQRERQGNSREHHCTVRRNDDGGGVTDDVEKIISEIKWCMTFDQAEECRGASGRKLRQTCIWCPKYQTHQKRKEEQKHEKDQ